MTGIRVTGKDLRRPGTREEEIDRWIAILSGIKDADMRCRALQQYVRSLLQPPKLTRGRLGNPQARRKQTLDDWEVFDAVEDILLQNPASSIANACSVLAKNRGLSEERGCVWRIVTGELILTVITLRK